MLKPVPTQVHHGAVCSLRMAPPQACTPPMLASASEDGICALLDAHDLHCVSRVSGHTDFVRSSGALELPNVDPSWHLQNKAFPRELLDWVLYPRASFLSDDSLQRLPPCVASGHESTYLSLSNLHNLKRYYSLQPGSVLKEMQQRRFSHVATTNDSCGIPLCTPSLRTRVSPSCGQEPLLAES